MSYNNDVLCNQIMQIARTIAVLDGKRQINLAVSWMIDYIEIVTILSSGDQNFIAKI